MSGGDDRKDTALFMFSPEEEKGCTVLGTARTISRRFQSRRERFRRVPCARESSCLHPELGKILLKAKRSNSHVNEAAATSDV